MTNVINMRVLGDEQLQPHQIYIGRPSKWGNQFQIGVNGLTREAVVAAYTKWIRDYVRKDLRNKVRKELQGKVLVCWCHPKSCHGDVLAKIAEEPMEA